MFTLLHGDMVIPFLTSIFFLGWFKHQGSKKVKGSWLKKGWYPDTLYKMGNDIDDQSPAFLSASFGSHISKNMLVVQWQAHCSRDVDELL